MQKEMAQCSLWRMMQRQQRWKQRAVVSTTMSAQLHYKSAERGTRRSMETSPGPHETPFAAQNTGCAHLQQDSVVTKLQIDRVWSRSRVDAGANHVPLRNKGQQLK